MRSTSVLGFQRRVPRHVAQARSRNQGARLDNSLKDLPARSQHMEVPLPSERAQTFRRVDPPWFLVTESLSSPVTMFLRYGFCLLLSGSASIIHRNLAKYLKGLGHADPTRIDAVKMIHEISKGMAYLHGQGVLHGDRKVRIPAVKTTIS